MLILGWFSLVAPSKAKVMLEMHLHGCGLETVDQSTLQEMFKLRHRVFKERLHWDVASTGGLERDRFDDLDPVYLILKNKNKVIASARLLKTTGPNMLRDIFPEVLAGEDAPNSPLIWESTRFVTDPDLPLSRTSHSLNRATSYLLAGMWELALEVRLISIVSVFNDSVGRVLQRAGCKIHKLGRPHKVGMDTLSAGLFPVSTEVLKRIRHRGQLGGRVLPQLSSAPALVTAKPPPLVSLYERRATSGRLPDFT